MALAHFTLTLTGSPQVLDTVVTAGVSREQTDLGARVIMLQPDGANSNPIYVGGPNATVSSTNHAFRLEAGASGVPPAPFFLEFSDAGPIKLAHFTVLGTNGEKLHIGQVQY